MRIAYMDETGNTGRRLDTPEQPFHMILTLVIDEEKVAVLHDHVRAAARRFCPTDCESPEFEFHGQDLFAGRGPFEGREPAERVEVFEEVLAGIGLAGGEAIIRGVEKAGLKRRYHQPYHPHDIALMFTIESIERMARQYDCRVLLVADEAKEVEDTAVRDLANYQEVGTAWGWKTEQIDRIIDTIHFVPSHSNWAIQVADCAAFIAGRLRRIRAGLVGKGQSAEAVEAIWHRQIEPYVHTNQIWFPTP
jgi:Protein of unknown function (DUF3800)